MSGRSRVAPTADTHRVTTLELFFDLLSVFALTQVTAGLPALASLAVLAGLLVGLVAYEAMCYAEARYRIRHEVEQHAG